MSTSTHGTAIPKGRGGALQAALLFAPVFILAWTGPGWILEGDVVPQATGIGFVALALLPAAIVLVARGALPSVRGLWFLLVPIVVALAWLTAANLNDTFEASRMMLQWIVALVCVVAGASLTPSGRSVFVRGAVVATIAYALVGLFDSDRAFTGALGNTGSVSEAALAGAVAGAALAAAGSGPWRVAGAVACLVYLAYTARVPVLAGSISCAAGIAALLFSRAPRVRPIAGVLLCASIGALVWPFAARVVLADLPAQVAGASSEPEKAGRAGAQPDVAARTGAGTERASPSGSEGGRESSAVGSPAGGVLVRLYLWKSSLAMSLAHPLAGVGTGQFAAKFPPWRDPREIERTTHGRRIAEETEVEHPHNDWLAPFLEGGWPAGIAWTMFLGLVAFRAWRRLHAFGERLPVAASDVALAAAAVALLVNAFVRGPLLQNPVSSLLAFVMFGALLAREPDAKRPFARRIVVWGAVVLLVVVIPRALAFVRHGNALQRLAQPDLAAERLSPAVVDVVVQRAVSDALAACPDSVPARSWSARIREARRDGRAVVIDAWLSVIALRPHRIEAWMQVGNQHAADKPAGARTAWSRVLELDPGHPGALQNLGTLELNAGRPGQGLAWLDRLPPHRQPSRAWLESLGARLTLRGIDDSAEAAFARADPDLADRTAEQCYALAKAARESERQRTIGDAWEARAHLKWAREHAAGGRFSDAVRSYRQALRLCSTHVEEPLRVHLELAAALMQSGKPDDARAQVAGLVPTSEDLAAMPDWAGAPLRTLLGEAIK